MKTWKKEQNRNWGYNNKGSCTKNEEKHPYVLNEQVDEFTGDSKNTRWNNDLVHLAQKRLLPPFEALVNSKSFISGKLGNCFMICSQL